MREHSEKPHPNLVKIIDSVIEQDRIYLVLEFCDDGDLSAQMQTNIYSEQQALEITY